MAKNLARGEGRIGMFNGRNQTRNPRTGLWTDRDPARQHLFHDIKAAGGAFKRGRIEGLSPSEQRWRERTAKAATYLHSNTALALLAAGCVVGIWFAGRVG